VKLLKLYHAIGESVKIPTTDRATPIALLFAWEHGENAPAVVLDDDRETDNAAQASTASYAAPDLSRRQDRRRWMHWHRRHPRPLHRMSQFRT
jgi:hypothetical protein